MNKRATRVSPVSWRDSPSGGLYTVAAGRYATGVRKIPLGLSLVALAALSPACRESTLAVRVVAADGGDPFLPPDGATQARFAIEGVSASAQTVNVAADGSFTLDLELGDGDQQPGRAVLEALVNGAVIGSGATPPVNWLALGPSLVPIFVQRRDSVVESPWRFARPRTSPWLFEASQTFAITLGGSTADAPVESFDALSLGTASGANIDAAFDPEASAVRLKDGRILLVRGCAALIWNATTNAVSMPPSGQSVPPERCAVLGSSVLQEPAGGALIVGGHDPMGPVARVDLVRDDGVWMSAPPMVTPRDRPALARLGPSEGLVAGGQRSGTFLERYSPTLATNQRTVTTGDRHVDERTAATLVALGDNLVLALGGVMLGSTDLAPDDVVIDARCVAGGCTQIVAGTPVLLRERRRDATAVRAEGDRVVVASGSTVGGVASAVELIDVSQARNPRGLGAIATLPFAGLSMLSLRTGSVLIAGGGRVETWLYRH